MSRRTFSNFICVSAISIAATITSPEVRGAPASFGGTDWARLAAVSVTVGSDDVPYVDQGEVGLPGGGGFGQSVASWTDGDSTVLVVGAVAEDNYEGAAYIFRREHPTAPWHQEVRVQASDGAAYDQFGTAVAVMHDLVVVAAPYHDKSVGKGAIYTFTRNTATGTWTQEYTQLTMAGTSDFGKRIALSNNWLVIGAPSSGAVGLAQTFHRDATAWTTGPALVPPDLPPAAGFGASVALDGTRALIGAPYDSTIQDHQGSAYLFEYDVSSSNWVFKRKLVDSSGQLQDYFGWSVAVSGDSAIVGAATSDGFVVSFRYIRATRDWAQQAGSLQSASGEYFFGASLAYDGAILAVGSGDTYGAVDLYSGTAAAWQLVGQFRGGDYYDGKLGTAVSVAGGEVFGGAPSAWWGNNPSGGVATFTASSGQWHASESLHAASDDDSASYFGDVVAASNDTVVVTAPTTPDRAIVFARDAAGQWQWEASLPANGLYLSSSNVAIDGDTLIVGEPSEDFGSHYSQGAAYVYVRTRTSSGVSWTQQDFLVNVDGDAYDSMGAFVSLSGETALVGVPGLNGYIGGAYVFVRSGTSWTLQATLTTSEALTSEGRIGYVGALDGDTAILGSGNQHGVYVFQRTGTKWTEHKKILVPTATNDCFGCSLALSNRHAFIGAPSRDTDSHKGQGGVYVFDITSGTQQSLIEAPDSADYAKFGTSVAAESNRLIVGAPGLSAAYAFARHGGNWSLQSSFIDNTSSALGVSVSVSRGMVILGAPHAGQHWGGRAYLFQDDRIFEDELE